VCDNARFGNASDCKLRITKSSDRRTRQPQNLPMEIEGVEYRAEYSSRCDLKFWMKCFPWSWSLILFRKTFRWRETLRILELKYRVNKYKLKCNTRACVYLYNNRM